MRVVEELAKVSPNKEMILTVGVFDGVHLGHKYLLSQLTGQAKRHDMLSGVVTFRQHPEEVLSPQTKLPRLTSLAERTSLLRKEGIDEVIILTFSPELAELSARQFVSLLKKYLRMRRLVIGPDFALGKNREGDANILHSLSMHMGFSVTSIPPIRINGESVSSTAIRNALANGDMKRVYRLLGRYFSVCGQVITGTHRGVELSFPAINLYVDTKQSLPTGGVYATLAHIDDKVYESITNISGSNELAVEVYISDYRGNLCDRELRIDIVERLRDEKKFDSAEKLKKRIIEDVKKTGQTGCSAACRPSRLQRSCY